MRTKLYAIFGVVLFFLACKEKAQEKAAAPTNAEATAGTMVPASWIQSRVTKAKEQLQASEAGTVVWNAMEAHGGLEKWFSNGFFSFHFNYQPLGEGTPRNTYNTVDTWRNKVRQKEALDTTLQYGWNGKEHWKLVRDSTSIAYDTKFWALTPFYFAGLPFVLDGAGVQLQLLPQTQYKNENWDVVKVTFASGTGDAPDDYYILYFHAATHKMGVIRYIVSYPAYFPEGGHMPEKFMDLFGEQTVAGITLPESYKTHWLSDKDLPGEYITSITLSEVSFDQGIDQRYFDPPQGATMVE
ncbi:hypothetical protein U1E44_10605 [Arenibacter sp. GZD96]|uniref:hypothetical protein n=1 Tax=Aurantibrevibacter litoralis TaxID=3106030 RepID=UPI002AFE28C2|nr:hypothetical protein [Arenibacter sp. GZD-96]MEA1786542.1 hypothetical protein [Arenibacter sp. GZD-96]